MERLPDELVLSVLERLPPRDLLRARRVCRRWRALAVLVLRAPGDELRVGRAVRALLVLARPPAPRLALRRAPLLRHLTLHAAAPLDERDLRALALLPHLDHLDAFTCARTLDRRLLPAAARLSSLVLNEHARPGLLRALAASRLRALHMFGRALHYSPRDLTALVTVRAAHLRELTLRCTELQERHYAAVAECRGLRALQLYSCWMLRREGALRLARLTALRRLHVTGARMLRPRALNEFLTALASDLRELALSATWLGDEHAAALGRQRGLRALEAWRVRVTARGVAALAGALPALRSLDVDVTLRVPLPRELRAHPALERLRCRLERDDPPRERESPARGAPHMRVLAPGARGGGGGGGAAQRGGGEGHLAEVFYYWAQLDTLEPLAIAWRTPLVVCEFLRD